MTWQLRSQRPSELEGRKQEARCEAGGRCNHRLQRDRVRVVGGSAPSASTLVEPRIKGHGVPVQKDDPLPQGSWSPSPTKVHHHVREHIGVGKSSSEEAMRSVPVREVGTMLCFFPQQLASSRRLPGHG
eukprot:763109-Hanusia_phi.AAC.5